MEKLIAERENVSLGEAKEKLAFWIDDICVDLAMGETVVLPDFGEFVVAYGNRLKFVQYTDRNLLLDAYGFAPIKLDEQVEPIAQQVIENRQAITNHHTNTIREVVEVPELPKKRSLRWLWITLISIFILLIATAVLIHFRIVKLPESVMAKYPSINNYLVEERNNGGVYFPNFNDNNQQNTDLKQENSEATDTTIPPDTITENSGSDIIIDPSEYDAINDSITKTIDSIQAAPVEYYYIIVKTAASYSDARAFSKEWARKGYVVQILYTSEKEPYKLSIGRFNSEEYAMTQLAEYKKEDSGLTNASIYKYANE